MKALDSRQKKHKTSPRGSRGRRVALATAIVLVVVGLTAGGLWWYSLGGEGGAPTTESVDETDDFTLKQTQAEQEAGKLLYQALADGTDEGVTQSTQELLGLANAAEERHEKAAYLSALVSLHMDAQKYDSALVYANQLDELEQSDLSASKLAGVYLEVGNFTEAARHYQVAADRTEKTENPSEESPYNHYMAMKHEAEGRL